MSDLRNAAIPLVDSVAWLTSESYWYPPHIVTSAWFEHTPFAYWLMSVVRPAVVVELGTHAGFSMFVFAEAAKRLGLDTRLYALDTWEGDDQAGFYSDEVLNSVTAITASDYPTSVTLVRGFFDDSVDTFADGSIDLLHVDGRHGYEDVAHDFETYRKKLSDRAVVLFHDTHEFQEGFGVHRFWNELSAAHPSFMFEHGHGLGVLAFGASTPAGILDFIAEANRDPERVRAVYSSLGASVGEIYEWTIGAEASRQRDRDAVEAERVRLGSEVLRLEAERVPIDAELATNSATIAGLTHELAQLHASTSWKLTRPVRAAGKKLGRG